MRRVRNQKIHTGNPALMFARGVESIVSDHMNHSRNLVEQPVSKKQRIVTQKDSSGNFFSLLMRQFASQ